MTSQNVPELRLDGFEGEWYETTIGKLSLLGNGKDYKHLNSGNIPVYGTGGYMLSVDSALSNDRDAVGIGRKGTIDKPYILRAPFWTVDTLFYVIPNIDTDLGFLHATFQTIDWKTKNSASGVPSLTSEAVTETVVGVPIGTGEQHAIGNIFIKLDATITSHRKKLDLLKQTKTSLLQRMFPQDGSTVPELRLDGFNSEWNRESLGNLAAVSSAARVHRDDWRKSGIPFFRTSDVTAMANGKKNERVYIDPALYQELTARSGRLAAGDILVVGGGSIGTPYIVPDNSPLYSKDADLLWVKPQPVLDSYFFTNFLATSVFTSYLKSISHIGTISHYTIEQAKVTPVPVPPTVEEQRAIGAVFSKLDTLISVEGQYIDKLTQTKTALLQKMFV